jgi:DNA replication protein DnaC
MKPPPGGKTLSKRKKRYILDNVKEINAETRSIKKIWSDALEGRISAEDAERKAAACQKKIESLLIAAGYEKDALEYRPQCAKCADTGYADGKICACLTRFYIDQLFTDSAITKRMSEENFDTFDIALYSDSCQNGSVSPRENIAKIVRKAQDFICAFGTCPENLFIQGKVGVGKSFLAHCIACDVLNQGHSVVYVTAYNLVEQLTAVSLGRQDKELFDAFLDAELLIIDDFGCERQTDYSEMLMLNIINERLVRAKPVIISSNLTASELNTRYDERIVSRIVGNFTGLRIIGEDLRLKRVRERQSTGD